jgi:hypothetical protein
MCIFIHIVVHISAHAIEREPRLVVKALLSFEYSGGTCPSLAVVISHSPCKGAFQKQLKFQLDRLRLE